MKLKMATSFQRMRLITRAISKTRALHTQERQENLFRKVLASSMAQTTNRSHLDCLITLVMHRLSLSRSPTAETEVRARKGQGASRKVSTLTATRSRQLLQRGHKQRPLRSSWASLLLHLDPKLAEDGTTQQFQSLNSLTSLSILNWCANKNVKRVSRESRWVKVQSIKESQAIWLKVCLKWQRMELMWTSSFSRKAGSRPIMSRFTRT